MARTYAAGDIELFAYDIVPDTVDGMDIGCVARYCGNIGHAGIHIGCADSMTHGLRLLHNGNM